MAKFCVVVVVVVVVVAAAASAAGDDDDQGFDVFLKISWLGRYFYCNTGVDQYFMVSSCGCRPDWPTVFFFVLFSCCLSRTFSITGI